MHVMPISICISCKISQMFAYDLHLMFNFDEICIIFFSCN